MKRNNREDQRDFFGMKIKRPIYEWIYKALMEKSSRLIECSKKLVERADSKYVYGTGIDYEHPPRTEREQTTVRKGVFITILVATILVAGFCAFFAIYYYSVNRAGIHFAEWNSSAGSFWGAVLGALFGGIASIASTALIINRSYRIDYHRERLEVLPVFNITITCETIEIEKAMKEAKRVASNNPHVFFDNVAFGELDKKDCDFSVYRIVNVGRGIAHKVMAEPITEYYLSEPKLEGIFPPEYEWIFVAPSPNEKGFSFSFYDIYENKYMQTVEVITYSDEKRKHLTVHPPELVKKTKRIRYVQ